MIRLNRLRSFVSALAASAGLLVAVSGASAEWKAAVDSQYGTRVAYPTHIFRPLPLEPDAMDRRFESADGRAQMSIAAYAFPDAGDVHALKARLLEDPQYANLTYEAGGRSWFVLSGYRGSDIYYEKIMVTCGGDLVSAFGITYPVEDRHRYDWIVERVEDSFRPGRRCP
ncbi:MAG: hypothetical protein AAGF59_11070 [Pseudomonadota bacterium]